MACSTRNPKFSANAVACLQRLIVSNALPRDSLADVLEALRESSSLALDIQLKVLQSLPSLLQNYGDLLTGPLLIAAFQVCFLLHNNKTAVVSNLAAASLKQLISSTFDSASTTEAAQGVNGTASDVSIGDTTIAIYGSRLDAYRVFDDICLVTDGHRPKYIQGASLAQIFGLELIEAILANHVEIIRGWPEQLHIIRIRLMPLLVRVLSEKSTFGVSVRSTRLAEVIVRKLLKEMTEDCEVILSLLNHMLEPESIPPWKRALFLETFRNLHADVGLTRRLYSHFDKTEGRRNIVRDQLGLLVRMASERPAIIGLGAQSSVPHVAVGDGDQAALQAGGVVGSIGAATINIDLHTPGISNRWSGIKMPLMEQIDKADPLPLPDTYIYKLVLDSLTSFEEGIARFLLPFSVPKEKKSKRKQKPVTEDSRPDSTDAERLVEDDSPIPRRSKALINPLTLQHHPMRDEIQTSSQMIEQCWPALLATSSTFLNAALDSDNFHTLLRALQKFTQIAGLLDLSTPRDAFLTTLGKHALPVSKGLRPPTSSATVYDESPPNSTDASRNSSPGPTTPKGKPPTKRQQTFDRSMPVLESRHLLCLRALLNLGIALGPSLRSSWTIILETLQQADLLMSSAKRAHQRPQSRDGPGRLADAEETEDLGLEISAAETAASRLFESSKEFDDEAFTEFVDRFCGLLAEQSNATNQPHVSKESLSPMTAPKRHQKLRSISGTPIEPAAGYHDSAFVLDNLRLMIRSNVQRFVRVDSKQSGWDMLDLNLMEVVACGENDVKLRTGAAIALNDMIVLTAITNSFEQKSTLEGIRARSLQTLRREVEAIHRDSNASRIVAQCDIDIHRSALEALRTILEHCGDSLTQGWIDALAIISSTFEIRSEMQQDLTPISRARSPVLIRAAFSPLELICSDFLATVPASTLTRLLQTLHLFAAQSCDLNISLTTATFYQAISDHALQDSAPLNLAQADQNVSIPSIPGGNFGSQQLPTAQIWVISLRSLVDLTTDSRSEVRRAMIHSVFRILESQVDSISVSDASSLYDIILHNLLEVNQGKYEESSNASDGSDKLLVAEWNNSSILIIDALSKLMAQWIDNFQAATKLLDVVSIFLSQIEKFLLRRSLIVSKVVFGGVKRIFSELEVRPKNLELLNTAWRLWFTYNPVDHDDLHDQEADNNDALLAHLFCLGQLLRLTGSELSIEDAKGVLGQLYTTVTSATASSYSSDVDSMTSVQKGVIESTKLLPSIDDDFDLHLLDFLKKLVVRAYTPPAVSHTSRGSYIALSKTSMSVMQSLIISKANQKSLASGSSLPAVAISALIVPVSLKYKWQRPGREPSTWKKATTTAVNIIQVAAHQLSISTEGGQGFWTETVNFVNGIISANTQLCSTPETIVTDESFDIEAFTSIKDLMSTFLGSDAISDSLREQFSASLFHNSFVHEPNPDDLALPGEPLLSGLKTDHFGRVKPLPPSPRSRLSYFLLDELFSLSSVTSNAERKRLAKAAAPYLILRCGLTLKAYAYDNPLRGRMPQPRTERKELWYILDGIVELRSDPEALPGNNVESGEKGHLRLLYALLLRALKSAWQDEETSSRIRTALEAVGGDWRL